MTNLMIMKKRRHHEKRRTLFYNRPSCNSIGKELYKLLKNDNASIVFLDGDILRNVFADNLRHSKEERHLLAERYVRIAKPLRFQAKKNIVYPAGRAYGY